MANKPQGRQKAPAAPAGVPTTPEPPVRRWPHPVGGLEAEQPPESALHFIRCALSYQNQLLADMKALLEEIAENTAEPAVREAKSEEET